MQRGLALLFILALAATCVGQTSRPTGPVKGRFYIDVDDGARLFINGTLAYTAGINVSMSPEVFLQPGDRIVAQLSNTGGGNWLKLVFVASDQKSAISFQRLHFKILPDVTVVDFAPQDWGKWNKLARSVNHGKDRLPVKNTADDVWGEGNNTALAAMITAEMFRQYIPPVGSGSAAQLPILLTVESFVDGGSTLHIRQDGVFWENGNYGKPGLLKHPTYVNGKEWMPKWTNAAQERGFDRSDLFPFRLDSMDVSVELLSNSESRDGNLADPTRTPIQIRKKPAEIEVFIPDPEPGQRWYKLQVRGRKRG